MYNLKDKAASIILLLTLVFWVVDASAKDIYIYPNEGQSNELLADDRFACHNWAVDESDFDPVELGVQTPRTVRVPLPRNNTEGATQQGTIVGSVAGGLIGSREGNTSEGTIIGAVIGTLAGAVIEGRGQRKSEELRNAERQSRIAEYDALRSNYRRALMACLVGKGYTVK